ncbi:hypothetical protein BH10PLA2_BH10PLA2_17770 [soil metagenome]
MSGYQARLAELVDRDARYAYEAYEFVFAALAFTQKLLNRVPRDEEAEPGPEYHVSGPELLHGIRTLALQEYGRMARVVFKLWGINRTDDFGEIIFNLVTENLMSKTEKDCRADFHEVYDFNQALVEDFHLELDEPEWMR